MTHIYTHIYTHCLSNAPLQTSSILIVTVWYHLENITIYNNTTKSAIDNYRMVLHGMMNKK